MFRAKTIELLILSSACLTNLTMAEEAPWNRHDWGTEESSRVLFRPARLILFRDGKIDFIASSLRYTFRSKTGDRKITSIEEEGQFFSGWGMVFHEIQTTAGRYDFSAPEGGVLEIRGNACGNEPRRLRLWTASKLGRIWLREMQQRSYPSPKSAEDLAKVITVSEPRVMAWVEDKRNLWLGVGFYAGEGSRGIGTVVQLNKANCKAQTRRPPSLAAASIMDMVRWRQDLWLATGDFMEGGWATRLGLVRFDTRSGRVEIFPKVNPLAGAFITAMARHGSTLWLATPGRFFALNMDTRALRAWRIVPRLELKTPRAVSSRPGGPARNKLGAGKYEVRWLGPSFAEVLTPDCETGFAEKGWVADPRINGTLDLGEIAASSKWSNPSSLLTYSTPADLKSRPMPQGWFLRVPVVGIGLRKGNWQRARVCAGWVEARPEDIRLTVEKVR